MSLTFSATLRSDRADAITAAIGSGAKIRIYSGTRPVHVSDAITGTLLAEATGGTPFAPSASSGVLTANPVTGDSAADASGTATHFRIFKSDGTTAVLDGSVTATGGGGDMTMPSTTITAGEPVAVSSIIITEAGA